MYKALTAILIITSLCANAQYEMRVTLYDVNKHMVDGVLTEYHSLFSNDVDGTDGKKMRNIDESFAIARTGSLLTLEYRQPIGNYDTTFLSLTQKRRSQYLVNLIAAAFPTNLNAFFVQGNNKTELSLTDSNWIKIDVDSSEVSNFSIEYSLKKIARASKLSVYPNPTDDGAVTLKTQMNGLYTFKVFNQFGTLVTMGQQQVSGNITQVPIGNAPGYYYIYVLLPDNSETLVTAIKN